MAAKVRASPGRSSKIRAPHEARLYRKLRSSSAVLAEEFAAYLERGDVLEGMARAAAAMEVEPAAKALVIVERAQKARRIPPDARRMVDRALAGAAGIWDQFEATITTDLGAASVGTFEAGSQTAIRQLGFTGSFNLRNPRVLDYLETRANMLAGAVADTTFEAIRDTITQGFFVEGRGPIDVARDLRNEFSFLSGPRSRNIARTETLVVQEQGQFEQYYQVGVARKKWLANPGARPGHAKANGQVVDIFEPFLVDNDEGVAEELMHPGDPTGSPSNICQCRCATAPIAEAADLGDPWLGD